MLRHQALSAFGTLPGEGTEIPARLVARIVADVQPARAVREHAERVAGTIAVSTAHGEAEPQKSVALHGATEEEVESLGDRSDPVTALIASPCDLLVVSESIRLAVHAYSEESSEVRVEDREFGGLSAHTEALSPAFAQPVELERR